VIFAVCAQYSFPAFGVVPGFLISMAAALLWQIGLFVVNRLRSARLGFGWVSSLPGCNKLPGESSEYYWRRIASMQLSSHAAEWRFRIRLNLPNARRNRFIAACRIVAKLAGAFPLPIQHPMQAIFDTWQWRGATPK